MFIVQQNGTLVRITGTPKKLRQAISGALAFGARDLFIKESLPYRPDYANIDLATVQTFEIK